MLLIIAGFPGGYFDGISSHIGSSQVRSGQASYVVVWLCLS